MKAKTHVLAGFCSGLMAAQVIGAHDANHAFLVALCAGVGALLPDLDHPNAALRQKMGLAGNVAFGWLRHRGPTHSLPLLLLLAAVGWYVHPVYGVAVAIGYASHIISDMATVAGVALLWPFTGRSLHILPPGLRLTTGGRVERLIAAAMLTVLVFAAVMSNPEVVQVFQRIVRETR